jgi:hypothetical protein
VRAGRGLQGLRGVGVRGRGRRAPVTHRYTCFTYLLAARAGFAQVLQGTRANLRDKYSLFRKCLRPVSLVGSDAALEAEGPGF